MTTPDYWRRRAKEAVTLAGQMQDDLSKAMMLRVAVEYERIAGVLARPIRKRIKTWHVFHSAQPISLTGLCGT
jgi:hypothetical protein